MRGKWMSPEFEAALPPDTLDEIRNERHDKIMDILDNLPEETREQLPAMPLPPWVQHLPDAEKENFEAIHNDTSLGFRERRQREKEFMENLPDDIRDTMRRERSRSRCRARGGRGKKIENDN